MGKTCRMPFWVKSVCLVQEKALLGALHSWLEALGFALFLLPKQNPFPPPHPPPAAPGAAPEKKKRKTTQALGHSSHSNPRLSWVRSPRKKSLRALGSASRQGGAGSRGALRPGHGLLGLLPEVDSVGVGDPGFHLLFRLLAKIII